MRIDNLGVSQYLGRVDNGTPAAYSNQNSRPEVTQNSKPEVTQSQNPNQNRKQGADDSIAALTDFGGIQSNVMRRAVSQMKMDSLLHEYQYFVGNSVNNTAGAADSNILTSDEDGVVIRKN